jgi:zinc transport system substrate-binding protein
LPNDNKDPTLKELSRLITKAKTAKIKCVFLEKGFNNKGAKLVAKHLGADVVELDPHSYFLIDNIRTIARCIAEIPQS